MIQQALATAKPRIPLTRILIVGDVMLDRYWFGDVSRISPEAPVPVVKVERTEERPGGAANVARNAAALGAQVCLLSVVGDDEAGQILERLMLAEGIETCLHRDKQLDTTIKLRVIGRQQQLLRVDFENKPNHEILCTQGLSFEQQLPQCDLLVLSDYGKGGLTHISEMIRMACAAGKPVLVDPKGRDYERYAGATLLTPNRTELEQVVGVWCDEADLQRRATNLREKLGVDAVLVTRSEEGMTLFTEKETFYQTAQAREVFDVSGAGDTVIATLAVMLGSGLDMVHAMCVANYAAGIVVGKLGTAVVNFDELQRVDA